MSNQSSFCLPGTHPFVVENAILASAGHVPQQQVFNPVPSVSSTPNTLNFSWAELEANISDADRNSVDPNARTMAWMIRSIFLN
jgi:hypothetical protein